MPVRPELLESAWTESDGLIREYLFQNEKSLDYDNAYWEFAFKPWNAFLTMPFPIGLITGPCFLVRQCYYESVHEVFYENQIENLWSRRVGLSKDGIVHKQLKRKPIGLNPMNPLCGECQCDYGRFPDYEIGAVTQVIPYDRVQDVIVEEPSGGLRQVIELCGIPGFLCTLGDMLMRVDSNAVVDTAGAEDELTIKGLVDATEFREAVLAMKYGRELPEAGVGSRQGAKQVSAEIAAPLRRPSKSLSMSSPDTVQINPLVTSSGHMAMAPGAMEMATMSSATAQRQTQLLESINAKLGQLVLLQTAMNSMQTGDAAEE